LAECADFFVDAFWSSKLKLATNGERGSAPRRRQQHDDKDAAMMLRQRNSLYQQQWAEFTKRYGNVRRNSELVVLKKKTNNDDDDEILGIVGVEVERVQFNADTIAFDQTVPLMSNLAISKAYRRRGLAERLVQAAERIVRDGTLNCDNENLYLYVEQKNRPAVSLYKKMGYTVVWKNPNAVSAVPTSDGSGWTTTTTTVLCMKKRLVPDKKWFGIL
jgi:ribosomal protein S18 acetylase RimI-like enzyme